MSFVTARPELLAATAGNLAAMGVVITASTADTTAPMVRMNRVAADKVSVPATVQAGVVDALAAS